MNNTYLKALAIPLLLSCFLGIAACVTTSGPVTTPAAPSYSPEPNDPLFWQLWESEHGLG